MLIAHDFRVPESMEMKLNTFLPRKRSLSPLQVSVSHLLINKALVNACRGPTRERIRPMRRDCHCGRTGEFISRACIACRHYAIVLNTSQLLTRQEARGVDASFKGLRVQSTYKGQEIGGNYLSRKEVTLRSIRDPYPRPLIALSQRFRSCTGTSV